MSLDTACVLEAMRASYIPRGDSGLWLVRKFDFDPRQCKIIKRTQGRIVQPGTHTFLSRYTDSTLHDGGEIVMEDTEHELRKHLNFVIRAQGRVLVTGLGLGCVVRGLLCNPLVESVHCVEESEDVLSLVQQHMPDDQRLKIVHDCAFRFANTTDETFDCAWHDIWTDTDSGEPHLAVSHQSLLFAYRLKAKQQDCWALPRHVRTACEMAGIPRVT